MKLMIITLTIAVFIGQWISQFADAKDAFDEGETIITNVVLQEGEISNMKINKINKHLWWKGIDAKGEAQEIMGVEQSVIICETKARVYYAEFPTIEEASQAAEFYSKNMASIFYKGLWDGEKNVIGDELWHSIESSGSALLIKSGKICVLVICSNTKQQKQIAELLGKHIDDKIKSGGHVIVPNDHEDHNSNVVLNVTPQHSVATADDDISRMIAQALAAYARLSDAFVAQEYEKVAPWISKDGKPVIFRVDKNSTSVMERKRRDFGRAQQIPLEVVFTEEKKSAVVKMFNQECSPANREITAGMIKELKAAGLPLGSAEVEIINVGKYTELERGSGRFGDITNKSTTMVRIPCPGSANIGKKYIPTSLSPLCQSMTREKELVILMYKIGDDWFWEPFGW